MIKTSQDAYIAGRQAAMEKIADSRLEHYLQIQPTLALQNLGYYLNPRKPLTFVAPGGTIAGTGLGTYLGDQNLRSAAISAAGALGGGNVGSTLGAGALDALSSLAGTSFSRDTNYNVQAASNLLGQLGGGAAAGYYTKKGK
jgi:hypothetical protein